MSAPFVSPGRSLAVVLHEAVMAVVLFGAIMLGVFAGDAAVHPPQPAERVAKIARVTR